VEAYRKFIIEGDLRALWFKQPEELHFFLFSDMLLICSKSVNYELVIHSWWYAKPWYDYVSYFGFDNVTIQDVPEYESIPPTLISIGDMIT
jgi:hypothetical protein